MKCETNNQNINLKIKDYLSTILHQDNRHIVNEVLNAKIYGNNLKFLRIQLSNTNIINNSL